MSAFRQSRLSDAFPRFLAGYALSSLGSQMHFVALVWLALSTGSAQLIGVVVLVRSVATLGIGLFGGVVADLLDRRLVMVTADGVRAVLVLGAAFLVGLQAIEAWHLIALSAALAAIDRIHDAALGAAIPNVVSSSRVTGANAQLATALNGAAILAPAAAGWLYATAGPAAVLGFDAATFMISGAVVMTLPPQPPTTANPSGRDPLAAVRDGLLYVIQSRALRWLLAVGVVATLAWGPTPVLMAVLAEDLGLGPQGYGLLLAATGVGALLGSIVAGRAATAVGNGRLLAAGYLIMGASSIFLGAASSLASAATLACARQAGNMLLIIPTVSIVQTTAVDAYRGRALTAIGTVPEFVRPVTLSTAGWLVSELGVARVFGTQGLVLVALGATLWARAPFKSLR